MPGGQRLSPRVEGRGPGLSSWIGRASKGHCGSATLGGEEGNLDTRADAASQELVGILDGSKETEGVPWPDNFRGSNKFQFENHL